jgi:pyrophosphatase PpaX
MFVLLPRCEEAPVKVEAAIFDWDGTLINLDERELHSINKALASVGLPPISKQRYVEGYYLNPYEEFGARNLIKKILSHETLIERALEIYRKEFSKTMHLIKLQEKAINLLRALKKKDISIAITTLRKRRAAVEREIQYLNLNGFVDVLVTRGDIGLQPWTKPSLSLVVERRAKQFLKTLSLLRTKPQKTIITGDSWWDIRAAKQIGAITAWVKTGFGAHNDFSKEEPDITLNDLEELLKHV